MLLRLALDSPRSSLPLALLARLALDHDQPPPAIRSRHRNAFDLVTAPLDNPSYLLRLPPVRLQEFGRQDNHWDPAPA